MYCIFSFLDLIKILNKNLPANQLFAINYYNNESPILSQSVTYLQRCIEDWYFHDFQPWFYTST